MKTITVKNMNLSVLIKILDYPMTFTQSRLKRRFVGLVMPYFEAMEKDRLEICERLSKKDEEGKPVIIDERYQFPDEVKEEYNIEIQKLFGEECVIDVPSAMRSDIGGIIHMIELSTVILTPEENGQVEMILEDFSKTPPIPPVQEDPLQEPAHTPHTV